MPCRCDGYEPFRTPMPAPRTRLAQAADFSLQSELFQLEEAEQHLERDIAALRRQERKVSELLDDMLDAFIIEHLTPDMQRALRRYWPQITQESAAARKAMR